MSGPWCRIGPCAIAAAARGRSRPASRTFRWRQVECWLALSLCASNLSKAANPWSGAEQLRRVGIVDVPCVDDRDAVLQGLGMTCEMAELFLRDLGGCSGDLNRGSACPTSQP
jgi:hypothetical protein